MYLVNSVANAQFADYDDELLQRRLTSVFHEWEIDGQEPL